MSSEEPLERSADALNEARTAAGEAKDSMAPTEEEIKDDNEGRSTG